MPTVAFFKNRRRLLGSFLDLSTWILREPCNEPTRPVRCHIRDSCDQSAADLDFVHRSNVHDLVLLHNSEGLRKLIEPWTPTRSASGQIEVVWRSWLFWRYVLRPQ